MDSHWSLWITTDLYGLLLIIMVSYEWLIINNDYYELLFVILGY